MMGSVAEILEKKKVRYIRIDGATSRFDWTMVFPSLYNGFLNQ